MTAPQQQKRKFAGPVLVTANRLTDGAVVYRTADGEWSANFAAAELIASSADAEMRLQSALRDGLKAVGAYIAPVSLNGDAHAEPANSRESIRLHGPTFALPGVEN